jgi:ABC-type glycerol-3-phosphate transport system substrate-binding protein
VRRCSLVLVCVAACTDAGAPPPPDVALLHTFGPSESEAIDGLLAARGIRFAGRLVPFARGQQAIEEVVAAGTDCPDLIRIDATWLPGLAARRALVDPPAALAALDWLPEARELGTIDGALRAVPQTVDGLVALVHGGAMPEAADLEAWIAAAVARSRADTGPRDPSSGSSGSAVAGRHGAARWAIGLRVDGYWFVPFLRARGTDLAAPGRAGLAAPAAEEALARFAALFGDVAAPAPPSGTEAKDEARRFDAGEIGALVTGPWAVPDLELPATIVASPVPGAPRGGQLLVVPACAPRPERGWQLAEALTAVDVQVELAQRFATMPTREAAMAQSPALVRSIHDALAGATALPRAPTTPLLFDDLTPAVAAVVAGDATPEEALAGVRRAWARILGGAP